MFLTEEEIRKLLLAAKQGKYGTRDHLMILMAFRHAFRVSELIDVRISDLDLEAGRIFVRRLKSSTSTTQPIPGDEIRAIRAVLRMRGELTVSLPCRARAIHSPGGQLLGPSGWRASESRDSRPSSHASTQHGLLPRKSRVRYAADPGLPRSRKHQSHRQIHENGCIPVRGAREVAGAVKTGDDLGPLRLRSCGDVVERSHQPALAYDFCRFPRGPL